MIELLMQLYAIIRRYLSNQLACYSYMSLALSLVHYSKSMDRVERPGTYQSHFIGVELYDPTLIQASLGDRDKGGLVWIKIFSTPHSPLLIGSLC